MTRHLSFPVMDKLTESGGNARFLFAATSMQGWRQNMEDAYTAILHLADGSESESDKSDTTNSFFAVYDGHGIQGGAAVAKFAADHLHQKLVKGEDYRENLYKAALKRAFLAIDEDLREDPDHTKDTSGGSTALVVLITEHGKIFVAHVGDSGCTVSTGGKETQLTYDHRSTDSDELDRILCAGGILYQEFVRSPGVVGEGLGMSRALGDLRFKRDSSLSPERQIVTADPEITTHLISKEDEFLILATDGIWDCLTWQQGINFVRHHVSKGKTLTEISELMCDYCLRPNDRMSATEDFTIGLDNTAVIIVAILNGRTEEEWYAWVTGRVKMAGVLPPDIPELYSADEMKSFKELVEARKGVQELGLENAGEP